MVIATLVYSFTCFWIDVMMTCLSRLAGLFVPLRSRILIGGYYKQLQRKGDSRVDADGIHASAHSINSGRDARTNN